MRKKRYWLLLTSLLLIAATIFSFPCIAADDNVTGGDGDTEGAAAGYGMYAPREHLWKVSLYVGKKDTANKSSSLVNDYYLVGNTHIYLKNTDWLTAKRTKDGAHRYKAPSTAPIIKCSIITAPSWGITQAIRL